MVSCFYEQFLIERAPIEYDKNNYLWFWIFFLGKKRNFQSYATRKIIWICEVVQIANEFGYKQKR